MELELASRPVGIHRDWDVPNPVAGPPTTTGPSSFNGPSQTSISQRRRSSAAAMSRPAGPPPQVPIPNLPPTSLIPRPHSPANLQQDSIPAAQDSLSDSPPKSMLNAGHPPPSPHQDILPDRLLLSPPNSRSNHNSRPSSRRTLTRALELAREAVSLDGTNEDPHGAVKAYGRSVALLSEVMERVRRGEDSTETHRRGTGRRRTLVAQEEEVRRLKSIHDTYADRMNILCLIYSIPSQPHNISGYSGASESTESTQPSSRSSSPSSESPPNNQYTSDEDGANEYVELDFGQRLGQGDDDGTEAIGTAMFGLDDSGDTTALEPSVESHHPYAAAYEPQPATIVSPSRNAHRNSTIVRRARASSNLPPPPPPPLNSLPPAPEAQSESLLQPALPVDPVSRHLTHQRNGSGSRLSILREDPFLKRQQNEDEHISAERVNPPVTSRNGIRDSHPLPPLPSPSSTGTVNSSPGTPRNTGVPSSPRSSNTTPNSRRRNMSTLSNQSSASSTQSNLINSSTFMGTISQRRSRTTPSGRSVSPSGSTASVGSIPSQRPAASSLPANSSAAPGMRARAISQPGRQPLLVSDRINALDSRPPMPPANGMTRSVSQYHKSITPPSLQVQTDMVPAQYLIPPPPVMAGNLPTTPISPLPAIAPNDPVLKPYHMMSLLRTTMTSQSGGYVTRRLHVPQEVWSQGGAKLANVLEKVRVVAILCQSLEELQAGSAQYFKSGAVGTGVGAGMSRKDGEAWVARIEEFSSVCDGVVANFGKKLGVGEGFVTKKSTGVTSWVTRRFDKFTNGKNLDSPAAYVQGLKQLFLYAQVLDQHTKAIISRPVDPTYAALPSDIRMAVETKLKRSSEFFASVVLTFVVRDLSQLLDKYARKCEKWLAE